MQLWKRQAIPLLDLNMRYTMKAWETQFDEPWLRLAKKIAEITILPFVFLAASEALCKNGLFIVLNLGISLFNFIASLTHTAPPLCPDDAV